MAYADYIGHCNLFSTIAEGFRTHSLFSRITSKERISNDFFLYFIQCFSHLRHGTLDKRFTGMRVIYHHDIL